MPLRTPVFKTGAIAVLPTLRNAQGERCQSGADASTLFSGFQKQRSCGNFATALVCARSLATAVITCGIHYESGYLRASQCNNLHVGNLCTPRRRRSLRRWFWSRTSDHISAFLSRFKKHGITLFRHGAPSIQLYIYRQVNFLTKPA